MARKKARIGDGAYENMATGLGFASMDKTEGVRARAYVPADLAGLAAMKTRDGIAAFIVDGIPEVSLMNDISIAGDTDGAALKLFETSGLRRALKRAGADTRLTGGAVVVTEYEGDTPESLASPPSPGAKVAGYRVYSVGRVDLRREDFDGDEPRLFRVGKLDGSYAEVHASRCAAFHGAELPDVLGDGSLSERYFGVSALLPVEQSLRELAAVSGAIFNMAQETGVLLMRLGSLNMMLSKPDCGVNDVHRVLSLAKLTMNSMRAVFAGKDDGFEILNHSFAGLPEIWQKAMNLVSSKSRIPVSILFGQGATGLAQTNEGDLKAWAQTVGAWRSDCLYRPACRLLADLTRRNLGREMSEFGWGAVDEMTLRETLDAKKLQADTLKAYYDMGVLSPDEIREGVFVNGHGWEVSVDGDSSGEG